MKEIKFRAYHIEKEKMINIKNLLSFSSDGDIWINENKQTPLNSFSGWVSKDFKLMQYTGLKDKNDIEVYHKDIGKDKFGKKVIVEWCEEHLCYGLLTIDETVKDEWNFCLKDLVEIIGNIYENKEELA